MTIAEHISRIRNTFKMVEVDTKVTDRYIYSLMKKHRDWLISQRDSRLEIMRLPQLFQPYVCVELIEVDPVRCCNISSRCRIKRTKEKVPTIVEAGNGPLIRNVTSLDGFHQLHPTTPQSYSRKLIKTTSKFDKTKYYWFSDGYLYFPNIEWDAISIEAYFSDDISALNCDTADEAPCRNKQDEEFFIPSDLIGRMDNAIYQDLGIYNQLQRDEKLDNNENTK